LIGRKGQAATEYLIILAVVVIIALIVIGVMGGFPGMTQGISERESASYWASGDVGIIKYSFSEDGANNLIVIRNNKAFPIRLNNVNVDGTDVLPRTYIVAPGSTRNFTFDAVNCTTQGTTYSYNVNIIYSDPQYSTTYNFTGEKPLVGTCN